MNDHYHNNVSTLLGVIMGNLALATFERTAKEKDIAIKGMYAALNELTTPGSDLHSKDMTGKDIIEVFNKHKEKL